MYESNADGGGESLLCTASCDNVFLSAARHLVPAHLCLNAVHQNDG